MTWAKGWLKKSKKGIQEQWVTYLDVTVRCNVEFMQTMGKWGWAVNETRLHCKGLLGYAQKVYFYPVSNKRFINWRLSYAIGFVF